jgi:hypothetical protein
MARSSRSGATGREEKREERIENGEWRREKGEERMENGE